MKRYSLNLTKSELSTLLAAVRTAMEEDCGKRVFNQYANVEAKLLNAKPARNFLVALKAAEVGLVNSLPLDGYDMGTLQMVRAAISEAERCAP